MASTRRILDLLEVPISVKDRQGVAFSQPVRGEVSFEGVSFRYASSGEGIEEIHLKVPAGHTLALVGATGSPPSCMPTRSW